MPKQANCTLIEIHKELTNILYSVLQTLEPEAWENPKQLVYSTVDDWDTAYHSYLLQNDTEVVKFPFATLTRSETQEAYAQWNNPLLVNDPPSNEVYEVKGALIRPVRIPFNWTLYRRDFEYLEQLADILIISGSDVQEHKFASEVLGQDSEFSFYFEAPLHTMIPAKEEKIRGRGFIFSLTVPIVVDCVLGIKKDQKLINQIIQNTILEDSNQIVNTNIIEP